jgi:hypothetical protein
MFSSTVSKIAMQADPDISDYISQGDTEVLAFLEVLSQRSLLNTEQLRINTRLSESLAGHSSLSLHRQVSSNWQHTCAPGRLMMRRRVCPARLLYIPLHFLFHVLACLLQTHSLLRALPPSLLAHILLPLTKATHFTAPAFIRHSSLPFGMGTQ